MACGNRLYKEIEWDHILPLGLGGTNAIDNWQALHPECHRRKTYGPNPSHALGGDRHAIDKARRLRSEKKKKKTIKSPGFTQWRRFNGEMVKR